MTGRADDTAGYVLPPVELAAVAAGDTSTVLGPIVPYDAVITGVELVPRANVTANGTNYGVLTIQNRGPLASGNVAAASRSWATVNSVAGTKERATLSGTPANLEVKAGDQLQFVRTTFGTGLAMPAMTALVTFRAR